MICVMRENMPSNYFPKQLINNWNNKFCSNIMLKSIFSRNNNQINNKILINFRMQILKKFKIIITTIINFAVFKKIIIIIIYNKMKVYMMI